MIKNGFMSQSIQLGASRQEFDKGLDFVENESVLVLTALLISSSKYAKRHINVCSGSDLCPPFSERPGTKVSFNVRISLV